jgi:hypothetical protein
VDVRERCKQALDSPVKQNKLRALTQLLLSNGVQLFDNFGTWRITVAGRKTEQGFIRATDTDQIQTKYSTSISTSSNMQQDMVTPARPSLGRVGSRGRGKGAGKSRSLSAGMEEEGHPNAPGFEGHPYAAAYEGQSYATNFEGRPYAMGSDGFAAAFAAPAEPELQKGDFDQMLIGTGHTLANKFEHKLTHTLKCKHTLEQ